MVDLLALVEEDLGPYEKHNGRWYLWKCPFHGDTDPSLAVTPDTGTFYCFGCGETGDAIGWLMKKRGMSYKEACKYVGKEYTRPSPPPKEETVRHVDPPSEEWQTAVEYIIRETVPIHDERVLNWFQKRGLIQRTLDAWRIGYNSYPQVISGLWVPQGITIPCFGAGNFWYLKVRRPPWSGKNPKYTHIKGGKLMLYAVSSVKGKRPLLICESELDAVLVWQEAYSVIDVVAVGSARSKLTDTALLHLAKSTQWYVVLDPDEAGKKGAEWWKIFSPWRVKIVNPPYGRDITDFHMQGGDILEWVLENIV